MNRMSLCVWQSKPSTLVCVLIAAIATAGAGLLVSTTADTNVPQYQRRAAFQAACSEAAAELSLPLHSPITFVDDCRRPKVTPISNKPGHLIVTRVVDVQIGHDAARRTYSALMDGRHAEAWHVIRVESAPNELSITELAER